MDGEAGRWTTSGNIGLPPLARAMGVGRQQHGLGIMIGGDMNTHIWELDGCENENGRRMKENINEIGLQILNCVWNGLQMD